MQLILTRNLSNSFTQPAADYMKIVFAHNPHFHINKIESSPVEEAPFFPRKKKSLLIMLFCQEARRILKFLLEML